MSLHFDHVVHYVRKPEAIAATLDRFGIRAVEGGRHDDGGTYNALTYFDLSYIEWLGVFDKGLVERQIEDSTYSIVETLAAASFSEGVCRVAIRTDDIDQLAENFHKRGLSVHGPFDGRRTKPDGSVIQWRLLFAGDQTDRLPLPFFIQWEGSDEQRRDQLEQQSVIVPHAAGSLTLHHVGFAVKDMEATVRRWAQWFDLTPGEPFVDYTLQANGQALQLAGGNLIFYSPFDEGIVSEAYANRGESPFLVAISGTGKEEDVRIHGSTYRFLR